MMIFYLMSNAKLFKKQYLVNITNIYYKLQILKQILHKKAILLKLIQI
jgi:hypothetical protein